MKLPECPVHIDPLAKCLHPAATHADCTVGFKMWVESWTGWCLYPKPSIYTDYISNSQHGLTCRYLNLQTWAMLRKERFSLKTWGYQIYGIHKMEFPPPKSPKQRAVVCSCTEKLSPESLPFSHLPMRQHHWKCAGWLGEFMMPLPFLKPPLRWQPWMLVSGWGGGETSTSRVLPSAETIVEAIVLKASGWTRSSGRFLLSSSPPDLGKWMSKWNSFSHESPVGEGKGE